MIGHRGFALTRLCYRWTGALGRRILQENIRNNLPPAGAGNVYDLLCHGVKSRGIWQVYQAGGFIVRTCPERHQ